MLSKFVVVSSSIKLGPGEQTRNACWPYPEVWGAQVQGESPLAEEKKS